MALQFFNLNIQCDNLLFKKSEFNYGSYETNWRY